jgi:hypothetical protein
MEEIDPPDAHRPQGITVIGIFKGDKSCLLSRAAMLPVLKGHLESYLAPG